MGRPVTLFSGYSQKENRVTNYSLLMLRMLYEENPKYLGEVLAALVSEDISNHVGVSFHQQERHGSGIPDGLITQKAITVYIETKNWDWFYDKQLETHLAALNDEAQGLKVLLALGNFETNQLNRFDSIRSLCASKYSRTIFFQSAGFEDFLAKLKIPGLPKNLSDAVAEFEYFLNEENLLPSWKDRLDVINCAAIPEDILNGGVYMCPAEGGAYSHRRARYFGMYRNKRVDHLAEIEAVVDVDLDANTTEMNWNNGHKTDGELIKSAKQKVKELRPDSGPTRVFLLGRIHSTDFQKDSSGGMQSSKRYFDVAHLGAKSAAELADLLRGKQWSEWS